MKPSLKLLFLFLSGALLCQCQSRTPQLGQDPIEEIVGAMTIQEKAKMVTGVGRLSVDWAIVGNINGIVDGAAGNTHAIERLNIPTTVLADGPAGLRIAPTRKDTEKTFYCTGFPVGTALASSWDTQLVEEVGKAIGNETLEYGVDVLLAPGMNIQRNALCGRNFEYYSEDPLVTGKIASAYVKGVQSNGVGTSIKHFAANNHETDRRYLDVIVSERALREIYLKGFQIAIKEARPWTVMSSYNKINGLYTSQNPYLLKNILRDEWGFDGIVVSDWNGGIDPIAQMSAGNDLLMPGNEKQRTDIATTAQNGSLEQKYLDQNVSRILEYVLKTPRYQKYLYSNNPDLEAHAQIARRAAAETMVLLKNDDQTLPLKKEKKIALIGNASYNFIAGGKGSGDVNKAYVVSLFEGLKNAGFDLDNDIKKEYDSYIAKENERIAREHAKEKKLILATIRPIEKPVSKKAIEDMARESDIALITISRDSGESIDRDPENNFKLTSAELEMLSNTCNAFHRVGKKAVVILNIAGAIETASWKHLPDAILLSWQTGQEGGNAVTDILTGKINPSGKLAMTFPIHNEDNYSTKNLPRPDKTVLYQESIFVGYRYFDSFDVDPSYEFGFGKSYTDFEYSPLQIDKTVMDEQGIKVSVTIKNKGEYPGKEVVQLYVSAPGAALPKPEKELRAFAKTKLLNPGESQQLEFILTAADVASFCPDNPTRYWFAEKGLYRVMAAASSRDIRCQAEFSIPDDIITETVSPIMQAPAKIEEIVPQSFKGKQ